MFTSKVKFAAALFAILTESRGYIERSFETDPVSSNSVVIFWAAVAAIYAK